MNERGGSSQADRDATPAGTGHANGGASERVPAQAGPAEPQVQDSTVQDSALHDSAGQGSEGAEPLAAAQERIAELEDLRLRALADLDNTRKKCASLVSRAEAETRARVALQWLPVVDNLERALTHADADPGSIVDGIKAVRNQAVSVLAQLGYPRRDDDLGTEFDPARHEAVASRPDPAAPEGSVVEVIAPAYGEGDRQLRPAQVVVARSN
jgi:molecular chaperone GrpE